MREAPKSTPPKVWHTPPTEIRHPRRTDIIIFRTNSLSKTVLWRLKRPMKTARHLPEPYSLPQIKRRVKHTRSARPMPPAMPRLPIRSRSALIPSRKPCSRRTTVLTENPNGQSHSTRTPRTPRLPLRLPMRCPRHRKSSSRGF